jgi:hypothetical protein
VSLISLCLMIALVVLLVGGVWGLARSHLEPHAVEDVSYVALPRVLRELASTLRDGGVIFLRHGAAAAELQLYKRANGRQPDELRLSILNSGKTRESFARILEAWDRAAIGYELEASDTGAEPTSAVASFETQVAASFSAASYVVRVCFEAVGAGSDSRITAWALDRSFYLDRLQEAEELPAGPRRWLLIWLIRRSINRAP